MGTQTININSDAVVGFANRLEKLSRNAIPTAVRNTLSQTALDVKQRTMPRSAASTFKVRQRNFFKANSRVNFASGSDISKMKSVVGFVSSGLKGMNNSAVENLEQQEHGGLIGGKSFIPMKPARRGGNDSGLVKVDYRLSTLENVVDAKKVKAKTKKQKFIKAAFKAKKLYGNNAFVLGNQQNGNRRTLSRINSIQRNNSKRKLKIRRTALYTYKRGFRANVDRTDFMRRASMESGLRLEPIFISQAKKVFDRLNKK